MGLITVLAKLFAPMPVEGQLFPGVEKPSRTLALMLVADMIEKLPINSSVEPRDLYQCYAETKVFSWDRASIKVHPRGSVTTIREAIIYGTFVEFDPSDQKIIVKGMEKAHDLYLKRAEIIKQEQNQMKAVNLISKWVGVPTEEKTQQEVLDPNKYATLTTLAREAKEEDKRAFDTLEEAKLAWKKANEILTDRMKVLDGYLAQCKSEDTGVVSGSTTNKIN